MINQLPLLPAPRQFLPSGGTFSPEGSVVTEALVPKLGFAPEFVAAEAYEIELAPGSVHLRALEPAGLSYARSSWNQLKSAALLPTGTIQDEPRFAWRGLMLDVSRHFFPVPVVKALLDRLAGLKLNRFHWHLVDDQGWRLQIPALPRLTELATDGYYTTADVIEVVNYAAARGITVVPEIELPGHSSAAIAAYPELSCSGKTIPVQKDWGIFDEVYCASSESAAQMIETILAETCRLFPGPWVHIGGDEVRRTHWQSCPSCQQKIRRENLDGEAGLEAAFFRRMIGFLESRGKVAVGWNEMFEHVIPSTTVVQWWHRPDLARRSLEAGNPLLSSSTEYCYFDYPYVDSDPWFIRSFMKTTPVQTVYANPVVPPGCDDLVSGVLGGECCLWTEQVLPGQEHTRLDGRLEAFAEVYWSFDRRPGFDNFRQRLSLVFGP